MWGTVSNYAYYAKRNCCHNCPAAATTHGNDESRMGMSWRMQLRSLGCASLSKCSGFLPVLHYATPLLPTVYFRCFSPALPLPLFYPCSAPDPASVFVRTVMSISLAAHLHFIAHDLRVAYAQAQLCVRVSLSLYLCVRVI